jgi:hypothetical protein
MPSAKLPGAGLLSKTRANKIRSTETGRLLENIRPEYFEAFQKKYINPTKRGKSILFGDPKDNAVGGRRRTRNKKRLRRNRRTWRR